MKMDDTLKECVENFGLAPRKISILQRWGHLRVPYPQWLSSDSDDEILIHFGGVPKLLKEGIITWGCVVQANTQLYEKGSENHPGELVYSIGNSDFERIVLEGVAKRLYQLKGTAPEESDLAPIADYLTDEMVRVFGLPVPESVCPDMNCHISTTFFVRKHLPNGILNKPILPILVMPNGPKIAMPLPCKYWPDDFKAWWSA